MLNKVIRDLNETPGIQASFREPPTPELDALLEIVIEGRLHPLAIEAKKRAPYPGELARLFALRDHLGQWGTPTLVAPRIPESVGNQIVPLGWSWADEEGHYDLCLAPGVRLSRRQAAQRPNKASSRRSLPQGRGGIAIIRLLLSAPEDVFLRTSDLAAAARVTDARASQVVHKLQETRLVEKTGDGWNAARDELLEAFLTEYRGPGGTEALFYSLDDPRDAAVEVINRVTSSTYEHAPIAISADVGPDLIAPWRTPSKVVAYVNEHVNVDLTGLTEASDRASANLLIRFPADGSVFPSHPELAADLKGVSIPLADASQMIWDLYDLGGEDRAEAARYLGEWLTKRR